MKKTENNIYRVETDGFFGEFGRRDRMDSLTKTLEFVSKW